MLFFIAEGRGEILDSEDEVGGYPRLEETRAPFREADWDLATMTPKSGLYPGQKPGATGQARVQQADVEADAG